MKARSLILSFAAAMIALAPMAKADIWTTADNYYAQRENNRDNIAKARQEYLSILGQVTSKTDKLRAVSQLGRLAVYEGEMLLPKNDRDGRRAIFQGCWCKTPKVTGIPPLVSGSCQEEGFVDAISPAKLGEAHPAYFYFYGVCLAYWGEQGSLSEKLAFTKKITDSITAGQNLDTRFEGGGINRLSAGVKSNPATKPLGIYAPATALNEINKALSEGPYTGDPSSGALYYDNWQGKVSVLMQLAEDNPSGGYKQQAIDTAKAALTELQGKIEDDDLPTGRGAEAKFNYGKLKDYYKQLTGTEWE